MTFRLDRYAGALVLLLFLLIPPGLYGQGYQTHTVRQGDTLYGLGRQYGVSVAHIQELNGLTSNNLSIGQVLKIKPLAESVAAPAAQSRPSPTPTAVSSTPASTPSSTQVLPPTSSLPEDYFYVVKPKDNLYRIAVAHDIKVKDLLLWNGFADENQLIRPGDRLVVEDPATYDASADSEADSQPQTTQQLQIQSPAAADSVLIQRVYIVQRKDTLYRIAAENGMTVEALKKINNLSSNEIRVGQKLNLVTPRGGALSETSRPGLTEDDLRTKDRIRTDLALPVEGKVLSEYGIRNGRPHKGIDIGAKNGTPIYAVLDGTVVFSGYQGAYGNVIVIEHPDFVMTVYAHNEQNLVGVGDTVTKGQMIGTVGATGNASGPHLHFEYRIKGKAINPRKVLPLE